MTLQRARVQYDTVGRHRFTRRVPTEGTAESATDRISHQATIGLLIVAVAAYVVGLAIGGAKPSDTSTDSPVELRNQNIVAALEAHPTASLVGDFSRLLSVGQARNGGMSLVPLANCTTSVGSSQRYQAQSFAYLLSLDSTGYLSSGCTLDKLFAAYGRPSAITITAGTVEHPKEELVFYDHGSTVELSKPPTKPAVINPSRPVPLGQLDDTTCPGHRTVVQIVAHEDDDLLFMNPDLLQAIQQGDCVRTIYLTAGDAGSSKFYWLGRERGSEAAYALLGGIADDWTTTTVKLGKQRFVSMATSEATKRFSLIFMHLPDGKPDGQGFESSGFESLAKLFSGGLATISSVDSQSVYSRASLLQGLADLLWTYQPDEVRTQRPDSPGIIFGDHSDHLAVGQLVTAALKSYGAKQSTPSLRYYMGYPIREQAVNVDGDALALKEQAFFTYAQYDNAVCRTVEACIASGTYGEYLPRQYRSEP